MGSNKLISNNNRKPTKIYKIIFVRSYLLTKRLKTYGKRILYKDLHRNDSDYKTKYDGLTEIFLSLRFRENVITLHYGSSCYNKDMRKI